MEGGGGGAEGGQREREVVGYLMIYLVDQIAPVVQLKLTDHKVDKPYSHFIFS